MKNLVWVLIIFFITSSAHSQSLKSISIDNYSKKSELDESVSINLKLNYYLHFADIHNIEQGYGFLGETQIMTTKYFGWLFTANVLALVKNDHDGLHYTKFGGLVLTVGPKFYFNKSDLQGYASFGAGFGIGGFNLVLAVAPALGMEYKIGKGIKLNIETKSNIYVPPLPILSQFFNAGICIAL